MTAVGLLFSVYMVKPSPFCVLDELDAALDEANIGRFVDVVKGFVESSQFIIITHSRKTIGAADVLYGGRRNQPITPATRPEITALSRIHRQALHATVLGFEHPVTGETMRFVAPIPDDMRTLIDTLFHDIDVADLPDMAGPLPG